MTQPLILCDYTAVIARRDTDDLFDALEKYQQNGAEIYFSFYEQGGSTDKQHKYMQANYPGFMEQVLGKDTHADHGLITQQSFGYYKYNDKFWPLVCDHFGMNAKHVIFLDNDPFALADAKALRINAIDTGRYEQPLSKPLEWLDAAVATITRRVEPSGSAGKPVDAKIIRTVQNLNILTSKPLMN